MTKEFLASINKYRKQKQEFFRNTIRKILGRNLINGRYYRDGLGLEKDLRCK